MWRSKKTSLRVLRVSSLNVHLSSKEMLFAFPFSSPACLDISARLKDRNHMSILVSFSVVLPSLVLVLTLSK